MRTEDEIKLAVARLGGRIEATTENVPYSDQIKRDTLLWVLGKETEL